MRSRQAETLAGWTMDPELMKRGKSRTQQC